MTPGETNFITVSENRAEKWTLGVLGHMQQFNCALWFYTVCLYVILYAIVLPCVEVKRACASVCLLGCVGQMLMMSAVMSGSRLSQEKKLTHGLTDWPSLLGLETGYHTHVHLRVHMCRGPVSLCNTVLNAQVQRTKMSVKSWMTEEASLGRV